MATSQPHLPKTFVEEHMRSDMYATHPDFLSSVFGPECHDLRLQFVKISRADFINEAKMTTKNIYFPSSKEVTPIIHVSVPSGDYLYLCEVLRFGGDPDVLDSNGDTVLLLALRHLCMFDGVLRSPFCGNLPNIMPDFDRRLLRLAAMVQVLVEHHANVNIRGKDGATPLSLACDLGRFDLVELLLRHGADPAEAYIPTSAVKPMPPRNKARYDELVVKLRNELGTSPIRPPRPCPCFSGKLLSECHKAGELPYPPHHLCPCDSGKTYDICCLPKPNVSAKEVWMEEKGWGWISAGVDTKLAFEYTGDPDLLFDYLEQMKEQGGAWIRTTTADPRPQSATGPSQDLLHRMETLREEGLLDAGFVYAVRRVKFVPLCPKEPVPKTEASKRSDDWNAAIDRYIAQGTDPRPANEISEALKIGKSGGGLFRRCDGGCGTKEHVGTPKMRRCTKCKLAVYCSDTCHKADGLRHKTKCRVDARDEQPLRAQVVFQEHVLRKMKSEEKRRVLDLMSDFSQRLTI